MIVDFGRVIQMVGVAPEPVQNREFHPALIDKLRVRLSPFLSLRQSHYVDYCLVEIKEGDLAATSYFND